MKLNHSISPKTIIMSSDARGLEPNATVIASLLAHTEGPVWVRMFSRDMAPRVVESGRLRLEVIETPEALRLEGRVPAHVAAGATFDRMAAIRYCRDWERAVVLDYDQLVVGDPTELFEMDLGNALVAGRMWGRTLGEACREWFGRELPERWRDCEGYRYFYMGPVLNLAAIRESDVYERFVEFHGEANMEEQIALHVACRDRVAGFDGTLNSVPQWDGIGNDTRVLHFTGPAKPWQSPELTGAPMWRRQETTWEELTGGLWNPQALTGRNAARRREWISHVIGGTRQAGRPLRVIEVGGWDFAGSISLAREWMRGGDDRWFKVFRPHVDHAALSQAIERFGVGLGDLADQTAILDGEPVEILSSLLAGEGYWEGFDAVVLHAPRRADEFMAEATLLWRLLRPGGVMLIHPVAKRPGPVGRRIYRQGLNAFVDSVIDQVSARHGGYELALTKGEVRGSHRAGQAREDSGIADSAAAGEWSVVVTTYDNRGTPHLDILKSRNPGIEVFVARDERPGDNHYRWRNCDCVIRDWWRANAGRATGKRILFVEYDVLVNCQIPDWRGAGIAGKHRKDPERNPEWLWWPERDGLSETDGFTDSDATVAGLAPLGVLFATREALDALADPRWDGVFGRDLFCELRLPTVVAACGLPVEEVPLPWVWHFPGKAHPALPGIHHPVKT